MTLSYIFGLVGAALGVLDAILAARAPASAVTMGSLWALDAFTGVLIGALAAIFLALGDRLHRLLGGRIPRALLDGLLAAPPAVPLGIALFSGRGISRTPIGQIGPYVFPLIAVAAAFLGSALLRRAIRTAGRGNAIRRAGFGGLLALGSAAMLVTDRRYYPGLYTYLHVLLALSAVATLGLAARVIRPAPPRRGVAAAVTAAIVLLALPVFLAPSVPNAERPLVFEDSLIASRTAEAAWHLVDRDRDGFSPVLGGGDCDDSDASVNPVGFDITRNGVDEDCDGSDPTPFLRVVSKPYVTVPGAGRQIAAEAVKHPTMLIIVDALRADRVGLPRFPNLARLARESIAFERAYSPATRTSLSIPAVATGHSIYSPSEPTVAERIQAAGKRTALVTIQHVSRFLRFFGGPGFAMERGFDMVKIAPDRPLRPGQDFDGLGGHIDYWNGGEVTARVLEVLDLPSPPDFIWVHYFDLHQWAKLEMAGVTGKALDEGRYDAVLEALDAEIGKLMERAAGFNIVLTADHGEALGRSGRLFHGGYLSLEEVHVPLLIRIPGIAPERIEAPVALTDLGPTLCQMTGVSGEKGWTSRSLLALAGAIDPGPGPPILMFESREWSVVDGRWRLILSLKSGTRRLYDVEADPLETKNLADANAETTRRLLHLLLQMAALARADHPDYSPIGEKSTEAASVE